MPSRDLTVIIRKTQPADEEGGPNLRVGFLFDPKFEFETLKSGQSMLGPRKLVSTRTRYHLKRQKRKNRHDHQRNSY